MSAERIKESPFFTLYQDEPVQYLSWSAAYLDRTESKGYLEHSEKGQMNVHI